MFSLPKLGLFSPTLSPRQQASFFYQLAALLRSGFPVQQGLVMAGRSGAPQFKQYLETASHQVEQGENLATALAVPPHYFDRWTLSLIQVGEYSGALIEIAQRLAVAAEQGGLRQRRYRSITLSAVACVLGLVALLTALLQRGTAFLTQPGFWLLVVVLTGLLVWGGRWTVLSGPPWAKQLPLVGPILEARSLVHLADLAIPLRCGVPVLAALDLVKNHLPDGELRRALAIARHQVQRGHPLSQGLQGRLPLSILQMIRTGEETGQLDDMLTKIGEYYDSELERCIRQLQGILRPLAIVAIGSLVLLVGLRTLTSILKALPS